MRVTLIADNSEPQLNERRQGATSFLTDGPGVRDNFSPADILPVGVSTWRFPWWSHDPKAVGNFEEPGDEARSVGAIPKDDDGVDPDAGELLSDLIDVEPGIKAKPEVNITQLVPELRGKFQIIFEAYKKYGYAELKDNPVVITSGNDSDEHVTNSYHYKNRAIDVRGKHIPDKTLVKIAKYLEAKLGKGFRVWAELFSSKRWYRDHIHIEYRGAVKS